MQPAHLRIKTNEQTSYDLPLAQINVLDLNPLDASITLFAPFGTHSYKRLTYPSSEWEDQLSIYSPILTTPQEWYELHALPLGRRIFVHLSALKSVAFNAKQAELTCRFPDLILTMDNQQIPQIENAFTKLSLAQAQSHTSNAYPPQSLS